MRRTTVAEVMASDVITAPPDASFAQLARLLHGAGVRAVPIVDSEGVLLGVVSEADLMASAALADTRPGAGAPGTSAATNRRRRRAPRPRPSS